MKTIVVISDTHGNRRVIDNLHGVLEESDYIIHLGDTSADGAYIKSKYPDKTYLVNGNCDPVKLGENELVLQIENVKIFATHGHLYSAKHTLSKLAAKAKELNCEVVLYGHTHKADEREIDGVMLINPGTASKYSQKSYSYLVVNDRKTVCKIVETE